MPELLSYAETQKLLDELDIMHIAALRHFQQGTTGLLGMVGAQTAVKGASLAHVGDRSWAGLRSRRIIPEFKDSTALHLAPRWGAARAVFRAVFFHMHMGTNQ